MRTIPASQRRSAVAKGAISHSGGSEGVEAGMIKAGAAKDWLRLRRLRLGCGVRGSWAHGPGR